MMELNKIHLNDLIFFAENVPLPTSCACSDQITQDFQI